MLYWLTTQADYWIIICGRFSDEDKPVLKEIDAANTESNVAGQHFNKSIAQLTFTKSNAENSGDDRFPITCQVKNGEHHR